MITLDKQALEKAWDEYRDRHRYFSAEHLEAVITAYLAALPEARRAWARPEILKVNGAFVVSDNRERFREVGHIIEVEIREVRQP